MTTRLDRLLSLLDSGATPAVRSTAARQIGGIQKQHPDELFNLINRVYEYLGKKSWDTRVAAAQAIEAICRQVDEWDPSGNDDVKPQDQDWLRFSQFNVDSVLKHGKKLLGSAGTEYDDGLQGLDAQARVAAQRAQVKKQLGLGAEFLDEDLLDDKDLGADDYVKPSVTPQKRKSVDSAEEEEEEPAIDMSKLSARERNRMKRRARMEGKKKKVDMGPKKKGTNGATEERQVDVTEQSSGAIVVETRKDMRAAFSMSAGSWVFESVAEVLTVDLFDARWETRHGAGMALRELFKQHGYGAGRVAGASREINGQRNQGFLEDMCVRLLCVFALDRFGDFVSDHVVAPVRETCAQALGVMSQFLEPSRMKELQGALLHLIERGEAGGVWEVRHAGLAGLRYVVAVRRDLAGQLGPAALDAALAGLRDNDDDVRGVSAATLGPLVDSVATFQPQRILDVVDGVWAALSGDDLAASVGGVMDLLAKLFAQPLVREAVADAARENPAQYAFSRLIPRLYPFLRHVLAGVRRAVVQALQTFAEITSDEGELWVDDTCLRLVMENLILEAHTDIHEASARLWRALLELLDRCNVCVDKVVSEDWVGVLFFLVSIPIGRQLPAELFKGTAGAGDAAMRQQDVGLVGRDAIVRCRVSVATALGQLAAAKWSSPEKQTKAFAFLKHALSSGWALKMQLAAIIVEEAAMTKTTEPLVEPAELDAVLSLATIHDAAAGIPPVRSACQALVEAMTHARIHAAPAQLPDPFTLRDAQAIVAIPFEAPVRSKLHDIRKRVQAVISEAEAHEQAVLGTVRAAAAAAVVATGQLPAKLNAIIRAVMASIRAEECQLLQTRAAWAAARMASLCYAAQPPRTAAADKLVANIAALACADPWTAPVFADRKQQRDAILLLEVVQHEQNDAQMLAAAQASAQQASNPRGSAAKKKQPADVVPLVPTLVLSEEQARDRAARITVRGAESTLAALARQFGPSLFNDVPRLWECVSGAPRAVYGDDVQETCADDILDAADKLLAADDTHSQAVIDALRVVQALAPALDSALHEQLLVLLRWAAASVACQFAAVRHVAARAVAAVAGVATAPAMLLFIRSILPRLRDTARAHRRQGTAEAVYYVVQRLDEQVLPYVPFLMVPVLGRMSDPNEQTRLVCTNCFAQLLKLVPLEADIPDPPEFPSELVAQRAHERQFLAQLLDPSRRESFKIPVLIKATLRKYQQEGVDWLAFLNKYELHGVLCDDMGLGKTLQTICIIASDHHLRRERFRETEGRAPDSQPLPSLVVCPPTLIGHWEQEICRYTDVLKPLCYAGSPNERRPLIPQIAANAADVVIMSYDVVRNDIELLSHQHWNYCVLDEGHCIKNTKTKLTLAVKRLHARRRLILSGTPVQNNVLELWSLFDFLMPGFLGTERQFNELYSKPILQSRDAKQMSQTQAAGESALKALHKQVLPFLLRRMKEDVLQDLPPKIIQDYYCDLSPLQKFLYEEFARSTVTGSLRKSLGIKEEDESTQIAANGDDKKQATHVFQALQYLRKLCNHPALVLTPKHPLYDQVTADLASRNADLHTLDIAPKLQALKELLNQCGIGIAEEEDSSTQMVSASHRVLIFCQHKEMIERIEQDLFTRSMPTVTYRRVDGTVEARRRQEIVTQFNADPSIDCLLLTTHVGGLGLNLTGADTVIFVEHDYNPAMDLQAMDRAHRLGQTRVVNVYRLITRNTLEEKIMNVQAFKLHVANSIVNQQNAGLASMNTNELLDLFDVSPPKNKSEKKEQQGPAKSISKALEGLEELWDTSQYDDEYNLDQFIESLDQ
ncbi:TATA-binding protein-associated factor mot1 [Coemansia brasiliensis]|uniref:TATA-binding protein-associated factor mot1 n=1 Tax=Coemansia brasiliensis TaxID=2650707 RepID=A0A9W8M2F4_9FUNG|nr:TATA-binding protein-associated factor mot1 [Coemansia brasiliensis]